jgi:hypothetical protein
MTVDDAAASGDDIFDDARLSSTEVVAAIQLFPGFARLVRGGSGDFLCEHMVGFVSVSRDSAEIAMTRFSFASGMVGLVLRYYHRRGLCE